MKEAEKKAKAAAAASSTSHKGGTGAVAAAGVGGTRKKRKFEEVRRGRTVPLEIALMMVSQEEGMKKPDLKISIPDALKVIMVDDWENITKNKLVCRLISVFHSLS